MHFDSLHCNCSACTLPAKENDMSKTFWSIRNKLAMMMLITLLPATLGGAFLVIDFFNDHYNTDIARKELLALNASKNYLQYVVNTSQQDLELLTQIPQVREAVATLSGYLEAPFPQNPELEKLFAHFLKTRKLYDQIRLLNGDGQEVCRVNLNNGNTEIVSPENLQNKGSRYYFQVAKELSSGEFYVSPIDLNREHGRIERPLKPMLRITSPVYDRDGSFLGALVLNLYARPLLQTAISRTLADINDGLLIITDQDGYYLDHPDTAKQWGGPTDLNTGESLARDHPELFQSIQSGTSTETNINGEPYRTVTVLAHLWPNRSQYLAVTQLAPVTFLHGHAYESIKKVVIPLLMIAFIAGLVALYLGRNISNRVTLLRNAVDQFARGRLSARIPEMSGGDELSTLGSQVNSMATSLESLYQDLESQVAQ